jgi:Ras-related protein Rab-11A
LSFIETSALDASNVEAAFQNILSGERTIIDEPDNLLIKTSDTCDLTDIYHIVAKKNLDNTADVIQPVEGRGIDIAKSADDGGAKQGGKCC